MGSTPKGSRWDIPTASVPAVADQGHPTYRDLTRFRVSYCDLRDLRDLCMYVLYLGQYIVPPYYSV